MRRRQNEARAHEIAPGSMHTRVHAPTIVMALGAIMALVGLLYYWPLLATGIVVFVASLLFVIIQAVVDVARSD